jgi:sarcosine oxidase delta subunit
MSEFVLVSCPYCGEQSDLDVDEGGGTRQSYVQDCPVCCQPWQVEVRRDGDGDWSASVSTSDN